jgi:hypothetical protein
MMQARELAAPYNVVVLTPGSGKAMVDELQGFIFGRGWLA